MHKKHFSEQGWLDMEQYLYANGLPRQIAPRQTVSGFVFTHARKGTKAFNLDIFYTSAEPEWETFTFFVEVPGFVPDHAAVDFAGHEGDLRGHRVGLFGLRQSTARRNAVPFGEAPAAAGSRRVLGDENGMSTHWRLLTVVLRVRRPQPLVDDPAGVILDRA
jgi:hypothetical protein